jgi:hypothetical protein
MTHCDGKQETRASETRRKRHLRPTRFSLPGSVGDIDVYEELCPHSEDPEDGYLFHLVIQKTRRISLAVDFRVQILREASLSCIEGPRLRMMGKFLCRPSINRSKHSLIIGASSKILEVISHRSAHECRGCLKLNFRWGPV